MEVSPLLTLLPLLVMASPLPLSLVWVILYARHRKKLASKEEIAPKPFEPAIEATPGDLLRRFNSGERIYLRLQGKTARGGFFVLVWMFFALLATNLLPPHVNMYGTAGSLNERVWYSFLQGVSLASPIGFIAAIVTAMVAHVGVLGSPRTALNRTRPLSHDMLFWGRFGPALATLLSGYAAGLALSFALLLAFYGPVWKHLDVPAFSTATSAAPASVSLGTRHAGNPDDPDDPAFDEPAARFARRQKFVAETSAPQLFTSIPTSMALTFCAFTVLFCLPWQNSKLRLPKPVLIVFGAGIYFAFFRLFRSFSTDRHTVLFFYEHGALWQAIVVPASLCLALLLLARTLFARVET